MPGIASLGTISYNGFTFPAACDVEAIRTPVYTDSGMGLKYAEWKFTVSCVLSSTDLGLSNGAGIDDAFGPIRRALATPGRTFTYSGHGLGHLLGPSGVADGGFTVDASSDMSYGPKPAVLRFKNIGQGRAAEIVWEVVCAVVDCDSPQQKDPGDISYSLNWSFSDQNEGMTTRTISGTMSVHSHRQAQGKKITANPDKAFESFVKSVKRLEGFHRAVDRSYSMDRTRISFTITDTEIPSDNAFEPGIITCRARHNVRSASTSSIVAVLWENTISGSYTVAPGVPRALAWAAFTKLVLQRIGIVGLPNASGSGNTPSGGSAQPGGSSSSSSGSGGSSGSSNSAQPSGSANTPSTTTTGGGSGITMVTNLDITEDIYGRTMDFSISYIITSPLSALISKSGLWKPTGAKWSDWVTSIDKIIGPTGFAKLGYKDSEDIIITFCDPEEPLQKQDKPTKSASQPGGGGTPTLKGLGYLYYQNFVRFIRESNTVMHSPTGDGDADKPTNYDSGGASIPSSASTGNTVQDRGPSSLYVEIWGHAARLGSPPAVPGVKSVGGKAAILDTEKIDVIEGKTDANGSPIFSTKWQRRYYIPSNKSGKVELTNVPATTQ